MRKIIRVVSERRLHSDWPLCASSSRISQLRHLSKADINRVTASWNRHPGLYGIQDSAEPRHCVVQKQPHLEAENAALKARLLGADSR